MSAAREPADDDRDSARRAARDHLALALDVGDRDAALRLVELCGADFGVMKVGLELFVAAGPSLVREIVDRGSRVFLDLKLHDIPNTTERAAHRAGALGIWLLTLHTTGGPDMLAAGARGLAQGARQAPAASQADAHRALTPVALGVTVLTSEAVTSDEVLAQRAADAAGAGCGGIVCAAADLRVVTSAAPGLLRVVPGIRPQGVPAGDQHRVATPADALAAGADLLVVGRAVTAAPDPVAASAAVVAEVASELARTAP